MVVVSESAYRDRNWTSPKPAAAAVQEPDQAQDHSHAMDQARGAAQRD
jgi:hypothetical protein